MDERENGRESSEAPSSSSDFYSTSQPQQSTQQVATAVQPPASPTPEDHTPATHADGRENDADDEDSSSEEMDVSMSSKAPSPEPTPPLAQHAGVKRKLSDVAAIPPNQSLSIDNNTSKKLKLSDWPGRSNLQSNAHKARLPVQLLQQVFLHLSPVMLSRCVCVDSAMKHALTEAQALPKEKTSVYRVMDSEAIWTHSRKVFAANLPKPLPHCTELEMLQLVGGKTCQFCARDAVSAPATTPFNAGPGPDGVRVIWPFAIRTCGRCLDINTLKDVAFLVSAASKLRFGLPYIFLTPELHFVPEIQRHQPGGIPSHLRAAKVYYTQDIATIVAEFEDAKSLGDGAADEWEKGLRDRGIQLMKEAARWEQWEASMRLGSDLSQKLREYDLSSFPKLMKHGQGRFEVGGIVNGMQQPEPASVAHGGPGAIPPPPFHGFQNGFGAPYPVLQSQMPQVHRPIRDPQEVEAVRQARKLDIERRCMELEPPLEANVLQHIDSFQAAMQITAPMTDAAWDMLKPRILAQREAAELAEHQRHQQWAALQAASAVQTDADFARPARDPYDKEYEHAQEPLRKKLSEYAEECIEGSWNGARRLDKENTPIFAAEVMLHVHQRYLTDKEAGALPVTELLTATGSERNTPIPEPFLSLDNMKWVYDNKIRPLTDSHRRELFICAGCTEDRKPKWFAFEGLLQHYGAKHTTAFSKGNIVVHWPTSEWPDEPPFYKDPSQFIRAERRTSDHKHHHGRSRNTPQTSHEGPFAPPGSSRLLSENPFFSNQGQYSPRSANGRLHSSGGYQTTPYGHGNAHAAAPGYSHATRGPTEPSLEMSEHAQMTKLSNDAREVWDALDGVKELLECVRVQAVIHHIVNGFFHKFGLKPSLDLVTDALATNFQIKPIKTASGLACHICVASQTDGSANHQSYFARIRKVKLYNFSSLITHFKIMHLPRETVGHPDWSRDMIELPEQQIITELISAPGMDDDKLAIIAAAFPTAFPHKLPKIGLVQESLAEVGPDSGLANRLLDRLNKKPKQQPKKKGHSGGNGTNTPAREGSDEPWPEAKEDEYDPRRPMYLVTEERSADPARFDTDIARKASVGSSPLTSETLNLAPETLVALNNLSLPLQSQQSPPLENDGRERSPSVGRDDSTHSTNRPAESTPKTQPDISAILATLQSQIQPAHTGTPPTTISNRSDSAPKYPAPESRGRSHASHSHTRSQHNEQRHQAWRASGEPSPRFGSQVPVQLQNAQSFEQNRARHYVEPSYAPQNSPPQYRVFYDEAGREFTSQPPQPVKAWHHQQPTQYAPEHNRPPPPLARAYDASAFLPAPPPKPVYVDEYGRQLIPIDSAPAPVQYIPHPFEQQQQQPLNPGLQHGQIARPMYYEYVHPPSSAGAGQAGQRSWEQYRTQ